MPLDHSGLPGRMGWRCASMRHLEISPQVEDRQVDNLYGFEQFSLWDVEFHHRQEDLGAGD